MDPYETSDRRPRRRSLLQWCIDRLPFGLAFINPWAPAPMFMTYPASLPFEEAMRLFIEQEKEQDARDAEWIPVTVTVLNNEPAPRRTLMEIKRNNRVLQHRRRADRSWR